MTLQFRVKIKKKAKIDFVAKLSHYLRHSYTFRWGNSIRMFQAGAGNAFWGAFGIHFVMYWDAFCDVLGCIL